MSKNFQINKTTMFGAFLPRPVSEHLGLASVVDGRSRSAILRTLVVDYLKTTEIDDLVDTMARSIIESWENKRQKRKKTPEAFMSFLEREVRPSLRRRRVVDKYITQIFDRIGVLDATNKKHAE